MKLIEKILLPVDFSKSSEDAVETAINIASVFKSHIFLIHVIPDDTDLTTVLKDMLKTKATEKLAEIKGKIESKGINVDKTIVEHGNLIDKIISEADFSDVNMILIGSGNNTTGVKLGTTADKLIRKSEKPVWLASQGKSSNPSKILCAVDFSKSSARALKNSIHLARRFKAELTILTVAKNINSIYGMLIGSDDKEQKRVLANHENKFNKLLKDHDLHEVNYKTLIKQGSPEKEILETINNESINLLVIGAVGDSNDRYTLLGSVAEKVIREMPTSIIVMSSEDAVRVNLEIDMNNMMNCYIQGKELMKNGMNENAINHFRHCTSIDALYSPVWDSMAEAYERMGKNEEAKRYRNISKSIEERLWKQRVESEIKIEKLMK